MLLDDATNVGYNNGLGAQFGSEENPVGLIMLGTEATENCIIEKIIVKASTTENGDATMKVSVGGHQIGESVSLAQETNSYVFINEEGYIGGVIIEVENTTGTVYLKSICINNDGIETSIGHSAVSTQQSVAGKTLRNGQLIIIRNSKTYDAIGRQL